MCPEGLTPPAGPGLRAGLGLQRHFGNGRASALVEKVLATGGQSLEQVVRQVLKFQ